MLRRRLTNALWMAALVPLFLAAVLPDQVRTLVCRFSGATMDEDCCPSHPNERVQRQAQLLDEACCSIKTVDLATGVSDRRAETAPVRHYESLVAVVPTLAPIPVSRLALARSVAPPAVGPPIVLLKRSFLI